MIDKVAAIGASNMRLPPLCFLLCLVPGLLLPDRAKCGEPEPVASRSTVFIPGGQFGLKEGLPSPNTNGIVQTPDKVVWITTEEGLVRYDGVSFLSRQKGDVGGDDFPTNTLNTLWAMPDGRLWLAFSDHGVGLYDPKDNSIRRLGVNRQAPNALMGDDVWHFGQDATGRVWMMEYGEGFTIWDPATGQATHIASQSADATSWLPSNQLFNFSITADNTLWAVTLDSKIIRHNIDNGETRTYDLRLDKDDAFSNPIYTVKTTNEATYAGGYDGLFVYDPEDDRFRQLLSRRQLEDQFGKAMSLITLMSDGEDRLWVGTTDGLLYWNEQQIARVSIFEFGQILPLRDAVMAAYQDHEGGTWVLTDSSGIFKLNKNWSRFSYYLPFSEEDRLTGNHLWQVAKGEGGAYWLAYFKGRRLDKVHLSDKGFQPVLQSLHSPNIPPRPISMLYDKYDQLWIGSVDGLHLIQPKNGFQSRRLALPDDLAPEPLVGRIPSILAYQDHLWLTVYDAHHPAYMNLRQSPLRIRSFTTITLDPSEGQQRLLSSPEADHGHLWLLSPRVLRELDVKNNRLRTLLDKAGSLQDFFFVADSDRVWSLQDGTLHAWRWRDHNLVPSPEDNPLAKPAQPHLTEPALPDRAFYTHVLQDVQNQLWLGSRSGLLRIDLDTGEQFFYTEAEGLPSREIIDLQLTDQGQVMVVSKWGLVTPNPHFQPAPATPPPLVLQGIYHGENQLPPNTDITMPYNYGLLRIEYALMAFNNPRQNQYFYRLNPGDPWRQADGPQLSLMQLPPGQYHLQIKGRDPEGVESGIQAIRIAILPPPWRSPWAYTLYAISAIGLLFGGAWLWRRKLKHDFALQHASEKRRFAESQLAMTRSLTSTLDFNTILQRIVNEVKKRIRTDDVCLLLWDKKSGQHTLVTNSDHTPSHRELKALQTLSSSLLKSGTKSITRTQDKGHTLIVPFSGNSDTHGLLRLQRRHRPFQDRHIAMLQAYAAQSSVALENARLFSEVQRLAREANAASQAKSDFLARVSHEVRTPMNGILGMAELLLDAELSSEQRLYAEAIRNSGEHLLGIINDILDLSKIEAGKLELEHADFDLQQLLEEVVQLFAPPARKNRLALYYVLDPNLPCCRHGDALRLKQILFNLLSNAIKFTQRGHVVVRVSPDQKNPSRIHFCVEDSGIGIQESTAKTLFEPFVQADNATSRKYGGTGLGLAIARQLVEKMQGDIYAHGTPGAGSRFVFSVVLPLCQQPQGVPRTPRCPSVSLCAMINSPHIQAQLDNVLMLCGLSLHDPTATVCDWLLLDATGPLAAAQREKLSGINWQHTRLLVLAHDYKDLDHLPSVSAQQAQVLLLPLTAYRLARSLCGETEDARQPEAVQPSAKKDIKVLVVEDNPINHQVATEMLEKSGCTVDVVESAEEALARVRDEHYDIILSDYHLPDLDGICMTQKITQTQLREGHDPTPVILVTADLTDATWQKAMRTGICSILPKPFSRDALMAAIENALHRD